MIGKIFTLWVFKKKTRTQYPQKSLVNLLYTWTEPLQDINQQNIIVEKTDISLTNDSLAPKQYPELQPSSPASRSFAGEKQKQREKLHQNLLLANIWK